MAEISKKMLSQYRISKAEECYRAAENLLEDGLPADSANRPYYAIFHAARAILALDGVDFKKHSGAISYFQKHYIKTGILPMELSDTIRNAFNIRQDCDYEDFFLVSRQEVSGQLQSARRFIDTVTAYPQTQWEKPS